MNKAKNIQFIIFQSVLSSLSYFLLLNHLCISNFPRISFVIPIVLGIFTIIFFTLLPKKNSLLNNNFVKTCLTIYLYLSTTLFIIINSYIITDYFFTNMPFLQTSIILILIILLFSNFKINYVYDVTSFVFLILIIINSIIIFNTSFFKIDLLYNLSFNEKINSYSLLYIISFLYLFFDPIINYFIHEEITLKKNLIISTIISSIFSFITIFINYLYFAHQYLEFSLFPGFNALLTFIGPEFLDHFSILILIDALCFVILKGSYNISIIRNLFKDNVYSNILSFVILFSICYIIFNYTIGFSELNLIVGIVLTVLIFLIYFFIILRKEKENET